MTHPHPIFEKNRGPKLPVLGQKAPAKNALIKRSTTRLRMIRLHETDFSQQKSWPRQTNV